MGGRKDLITAGLTLGALADAEAKAKGKMSAIIATESGSAVSFTAADAAPVADLTAAIVPVQSGSGDPSPENIRPISGWTGAKVTRTGGNQLRNNSFNSPSYGVSCAVQTDDCVAVLSGTATQTIGFTVAKCQVQKGSTYTVSVEYPNQNCVVNVRKMFDNAYVGMVRAFTASGTATFTVDETFNAVDVRPTVDGGVSLSNCVVKYSLAIGSTATAYEPYRGDIYTVTFGSAGTVYGGTLDVTTGTLTVTKANIASYNGETLPGAWISDRDVYASGTTPTIGAQVVYELAEPLVYDLTPVEIRTLVGENHIWADTGDVTVMYSADTKAFIDNYIAARRNG